MGFRQTNIGLLLWLAVAWSLSAKDVMLMNRIGPSKSELFLANADGTGERPLLATSGFDYNGSFSADGQWIVFTSERNGFGQADIYRVHPSGEGLERLTDSPAFDDQGALSPDGTQLAFVSTRGTRKANIWILNLKTRELRNLTGAKELQSAPEKPGGFFRPSWSPDGKWIAFSSDRGTEWKGHSNGAGWEHVQELSIYVIRPDGKELRRLTQQGTCTGAPKWSTDGKRIVFYEVPVELTFFARVGVGPAVTSQIVSVDIASGKRTEHTTGPGLKVTPQFLPDSGIAYLVKAGPKQGLFYSGGMKAVEGKMRAPAWSADGRQVVYEKVDFTSRPQNQQLYSWDPNFEYRYTDVFPSFSRDGRLAVTDFLSTLGNPTATISTMDADGSNRRIVFDDKSGAAYSPTWSPDGQWLAFGFGGFFGARAKLPGKILMIKANGTGRQELTSGIPNGGFPSWSPDGKRIVFRVWTENEKGLRLLNLEDKSVKVLTTEYDNVPFWSPLGDRILFTRKAQGDFDIFTIRPDGTDLQQLTTTPGNDAHAIWTDDGKHVIWSSGRYGFKDEAVLYDNNPQPYAALFIMNADGSGQTQLTDSKWEDAMPKLIPNTRSLPKGF
jgi:Tol biopolymer transport system component